MLIVVIRWSDKGDDWCDGGAGGGSGDLKLLR